MRRIASHRLVPYFECLVILTSKRDNRQIRRSSFKIKKTPPRTSPKIML